MGHTAAHTPIADLQQTNRQKESNDEKAKRRTRLWGVLLALVMITLYTVPAFAAVIS